MPENKTRLWDASDIILPTKHTVFGRQSDGRPAPMPLVVSIDISEVEFS